MSFSGPLGGSEKTTVLKGLLLPCGLKSSPLIVFFVAGFVITDVILGDNIAVANGFIVIECSLLVALFSIVYHSITLDTVFPFSIVAKVYKPAFINKNKNELKIALFVNSGMDVPCLVEGKTE